MAESVKKEPATRQSKPLFAIPEPVNWVLYRFRRGAYEFINHFNTREGAESVAESMNRGHKIGWEDSVFTISTDDHKLIVAKGVSYVVSESTYTIVGM